MNDLPSLNEIQSLPPEWHAATLRRIEWLNTARPNQIPKSNGKLYNIWLAGRGYGKALCLETKVPTLKGWTTMGEIKENDIIFDEMGNQCNVTFISKIMINRNCYRIKFSDGTEIVADEDHEWLSQCKSSRKAFGRAKTPTIFPKIRTTKQILETLYLDRTDGRKEVNYSIDNCLPLKIKNMKYEISPYLIGLWLGDGDSKGSYIYCNPKDIDELSIYTGGKVVQRKCGRCPHLSFSKPPTHKLNGDFDSNGSLFSKLRFLNLFSNKHIPMEYMRGSYKQRLALLKGLMDSDGYIQENGNCEFCTISKSLSSQVYELVCSLGIKATEIVGDAKINGRFISLKYRISFTPYIPVFKLKRYLKYIKSPGRQFKRQLRRYITSIENVDSVPVRCIQVNSPSHLFLVTKSFIATHNTRVAVEDCWWDCWCKPNVRYGVVCATASDTRKTAFDGESGLISRIPPEIIENYNKSLLEIRLTNGSLIQGFSADEPNRLRGPQFHFVWVDELAAWRYMNEAWDMLMFCLRLGDETKINITTTPKPVSLLKELVKDKDSNVIRGSTFENAANLSKIQLKKLKEKYEGTRIGRQELYAEILEDVEGALWNNKMIEEAQGLEMEDCYRICVAIDPAISSNTSSNETGIVVCGKGNTRYGVLDDVSGVYTPNEWASKAIHAYDKWNADFIVAEVNQGGDMVESIIKNKRANIKVKKVHATKGKYKRAEPIAALYEQSMVYHLSIFDKLNAQLTTYVPGIDTDTSPDRMDALVWGLTELSGSKLFQIAIV